MKRVPTKLPFYPLSGSANVILSSGVISNLISYIPEILEALIAQVVKTVKAGDEIALIGFGTFKSAERAARTGRNPATGKEIKIPASVQPKFIAGKLFKEAVNSK